MNDQKFNSLYNNLNDEQKLAVSSIEGPVMVIAGPGTGKTSMLTLRIANILKQTDTKPENILALTFTESGVHSMRKKLLDIIGSLAFKVNIYTFHGFCNNIIMNFPEEFPRIVGSKNISEPEQISLMENIIENNNDLKILKPHGDKFYYVRSVLSAIRDLKREAVDPDIFENKIKDDLKNFEDIVDLYHESGVHKGKMKGKYVLFAKNLEKNKELTILFRAYEDSLRDLKLYDYEDMITEVLKVISSNHEFLLMLQEDYQYILADEHQDANSAQNKILELLSNFHQSPNLFIVGDEKQAIFRFQGASLDNFLYFKNLYPESLVISLNKNYRSLQGILDASHSLILNNSVADPLLRNPLVSKSKERKKGIFFYEFSKPDYELMFLVKDIKKKIEDGVPPTEISILYRDNKDAFRISRYLEKFGIEFSIISDQNILDSIEIKKIIILLRAINSILDDNLLARALSLDFLNIDPVSLQKIFRTISRKKVSIFDLIGNRKFLEESQIDSAAFLEIHSKFLNWHKLSKNKNLIEFFEKVINQSGLLDYFLKSKKSSDHLDKLSGIFSEMENFSQAHGIVFLSDFLKYIDVLENYGVLIKTGEKIRFGGINLMTAHKSKGREFDYVYIIQAFDKHWGNRMDRKIFHLQGSDPAVLNSIEDERRLFYVAITRARIGVSISYSKEDDEGKSRFPSQFILDIKDEFIEKVDVSADEAVFEKEKNLKFIGAESQNSIFDQDYVKELFLSQGLSVTALNNYLKCPWDYFFNNLIRLPRSYSVAQIYGSSIHNSLKAFFDKYKEEDVPVKFLTDKFEYFLSKNYLSSSDFEKYLKKGNESLKNFYLAHKSSWSKNILNELDVKIVIPLSLNENLVLRGMIDKVEFVENGSVNVVDYKTGKVRTRNYIEGKTKDSNGDYKRQLIFYKLIFDEHDKVGKKVVSGEIVFIEPDEKGRQRKEKFEISNEDVKNLKVLIEKVSAEIISCSFFDKACDNSKCEYCELRRMSNI